VTIAFDHRDAGTSEDRWRSIRPWRDAAPVDTDIDALVVLAAHPDDETLGAAGLIAQAAARRVPVTVIVATDGDASHPASPTYPARALARARRLEVAAAIDTLAPGAALIFLGLADGALRERRSRLSALLTGMLGAVTADSDPARVLVAATWRGDGHRDHRVLGEVAAEVADRCGAGFVEYPIWMWHWGDPDEPEAIAADRWLCLPLDEHTSALKRRALSVHTTQIRPLSPAPGDEAVLHPGMRAHFERDVEVFVGPATARTPAEPVDASAVESSLTGRPSMRAAYFEDFYARHADPWGFETRWYEQRKRDLLLAALPRPRAVRALEIGCATGILTTRLADRCDALIAFDVADEAVRRARARLGERPHVDVRRAALLAQWPAGSFDLIVLSEVGYYWSPHDRRRAIERIDRSLTHDGVLVACHWRHPVADYPATGDEVHHDIHEAGFVRALARHEEEDFVLEVLVREGTGSVARESGVIA
jgi:LmbE family N-acetylglucosaminyl deacetylase/SAM-dependent methyltransferase